MDKKLNKKIRRLIFLLFLTSIYLSTAAYSWFSTNRTVYISELSIKVQAQGGIEISADAKDWSTIITQEDISKASETYPGSINQLPMTMEPVSTGKIVNNGKLQMYYGYTENKGNDYMLLASKDSEQSGTEGRYMAFDIFLKSDTDTRLYLTNTSGASYEGITPGIQNSVRFAFLVEGNVLDKQNYLSAQTLNEASADSTYIWEPNYDTHSENGIKNAQQVYGIKVSESNSERIIYDGLISDIKKDDNILVNEASEANHPDKFKKVNVDYATKAENEENVEIFSLKEGITKVRVYIWLEGQDVDCENKSAIGDVIFNFQFTSNPS